MGGRHSVEYRTDPKLVEALQHAQLQNKNMMDQMTTIQREHMTQVDELRKERAEFMEEVEKMKRKAEEPKEDYNRIVKKAHDIVSQAKHKVALVFGSQGAGKSTICAYMFGIKDAVTGTGNTHVTTELTLHESNKVPFDVVDTVGKMPDIRGTMRVIACAYNRGWDPAALIVVHAGRTGHFDTMASFLQASKVNTLNFEPRSFYRCLKQTGIDTESAQQCFDTNPAVQKCLDLTIFPDEHPLPRINSMSPSNFSVKECATSDNVLHILKDLTWTKAQQASDYQGIANSLAFYLAKSIVERAEFSGGDLEFIERE